MTCPASIIVFNYRFNTIFHFLGRIRKHSASLKLAHEAGHFLTSCGMGKVSWVISYPLTKDVEIPKLLSNSCKLRRTGLVQSFKSDHDRREQSTRSSKLAIETQEYCSEF